MECPFCGNAPWHSDYLYNIFIADKNNIETYQIATLVTHYRHDHQESWDKMNISRYYRRAVPGYDYDDQKEVYNNRAKRQLLRKFMKFETGLNQEKVKKLIVATSNLQANDEMTKKLIEKLLGKLNLGDQ
ncbi:MAG: hypothetical protein ACXAD7_21140 [Candidatus Kariarchaeaceae archaeon]